MADWCCIPDASHPNKPMFVDLDLFRRNQMIPLKEKIHPEFFPHTQQVVTEAVVGATLIFTQHQLELLLMFLGDYTKLLRDDEHEPHPWVVDLMRDLKRVQNGVRIERKNDEPPTSPR